MLLVAAERGTRRARTSANIKAAMEAKKDQNPGWVGMDVCLRNPYLSPMLGMIRTWWRPCRVVISAKRVIRAPNLGSTHLLPTCFALLAPYSPYFTSNMNDCSQDTCHIMINRQLAPWVAVGCPCGVTSLRSACSHSPTTIPP